MGHYDCKSCDATPYEEHSPDCERFGAKPAPTEGTDMNQIEKVARALCEHAIIKAYTRQDRVEELAPFRAVEVDHLWRNHIPEAKAAIAALKARGV